MKDLIITFENKTQRTRLYLNWELRMIEEETLYLQEDGKISKSLLQREIYNEDTSLKCMKILFESELKAITKFYRTKGKFKIKL